MFISSILVQSKNMKMHLKEILSAGCNVTEFFCLLLYTDYLSDLLKKIHIAFNYDVNVECQIQNFSYNFFRVMFITGTHIHIDQTLKLRFLGQRDLKMCKSIKISTLKIYLQINTFSTIHG